MPSTHAWFPASICLRAPGSIAPLCARHAGEKSKRAITTGFNMLWLPSLMNNSPSQPNVLQLPSNRPLFATILSAPSMPFEALLQAADLHLECSRLDDAPIVEADERKIVGRKPERNPPLPAGAEVYFCEAFQALDRRCDAGKSFREIQFDNLLTLAVARIFHIHVDLDPLRSAGRRGQDLQTGIL